MNETIYRHDRRYRQIDLEVGILPPAKDRAKVIGLAYNEPNLTLEEKYSLPFSKYLEINGRFFETIPDSELLLFKGKINLISSHFGVLSYTSSEDFCVQLKRALQLLKKDGSLHIHTTGENIGIQPSPGMVNLTYEDLIARHRNFFEHIKGTKLIEYGHDGGTVIVLKRTEGEVEVPKLVPVPGAFKASKPPKRYFYFPESYP